jgi:hypothetical protein
MKTGKIMVEWEADGKLGIKTSLSVCDSADKQLMIRVLLDAAKAINESSSSLIMPVGAPTRILAG